MYEPHGHRRDILRRALGLLIRADALSVALRARDIGRIERERRTGAVAPALRACAAHRRHDLESGAARIVRAGAAFEHRTAQRGDERVVVE
jgi:hypothetical protein